MIEQRTTILGGTTLLMASSVFNAVVSIFTTSLIAKSIGPELYGRYTFGLTFILTFLGLATFGLEAVYVRNGATEKNHVPRIIELLHLRSIIAISFTLLAVLMGHVLEYPAQLMTVIYILCGGLFFQILYETLLGLYKSLEQMHIVALASVAFRVFTAVVILVSIYSGVGLLGVVSAYTIGNALVFVGLFVWFYREFRLFHFDFQPSRWLSLIKEGVPFYISGLLAVFYARFSLLVLSKTAGEFDMGLYMCAQALVESLWFIPAAFQTTFFSAFSRLYGTSPESLGLTYEKVAKYLIILTVGVCSGTILVAKPIIDLIFGSQYEGAVSTLQILIFYWAFVAISQTQSSLLYSIRKEIIQTKVMVLACLVTVVLSFTLIPRFGIIGAAFALTMAEALVVAVLTTVLWQAQLRYKPGIVLGSLAVSVALMVVLVKVSLNINVFIGIGVGTNEHSTCKTNFHRKGTEFCALMNDQNVRQVNF